jgi:hypothetical protein
LPIRVVVFVVDLIAVITVAVANAVTALFVSPLLPPLCCCCRHLCVAITAVFVSPPAVAIADAVSVAVAITAVAVSFTAALS